MKSVLTLEYERYASLDELSDDDKELVGAARESAKNAYAPFSGFKVGAAVRFSSGEVLCANNQECDAYPSGMCAERALLYFVGANYADRVVESLAVCSVSSSSECYPCGACREVIKDFEKRQASKIRIIMAGETTASVVAGAKDLLPFTFELDYV